MVDSMIQDREASRRFFLAVWEKYQDESPMEPMEEMVLGVLLEHPEYHHLLKEDEDILMREFTLDDGMVNPFLHMGMHITIREQVQINRPSGITGIYMNLVAGYETAHDLEHRMMDCLGEALWTSQQNNTLPDERAYLECIKLIG